MTDYLKHYGTPRHSGRYPWGSGDNPHQRNQSWLEYVQQLRDEGLTDKQIYEGMGINSTQFRAKIHLATVEKRQADVAEAIRLKDTGMSVAAIARQMGKNESSVRSLLNPTLAERASRTENIANMLKDSVNEKGYIDVGAGSELYIGVSRGMLKNSVALLEEQGYKVQYLITEQAGNPGKKTTTMVLLKEDVPYSELYANRDKVSLFTDHYTEDGGRSVLGLEPIRSIDSDRLEIAYSSGKDGVIELRRGVDEISLGESRYAQVRIGVDGTHYIKGMAMYSDDLPDGVDIRFNTSKISTGNKIDVLKVNEDDPDNPFGSTVRQRHYIDADGNRQLSAINIIGTDGKLNEEGRWFEWSNTLSSQFLSKQNPDLAQKQLDLAYKIKQDEYDEIMKLTNPAVREKLLQEFSDGCDSAAVHLKGASMPRQATHVILPVDDLPENQVFAPNYRQGEKVVLIRYPHGGTFEIPELTVNNLAASARKQFPGDPLKDAIGINPKVAERLSGADFDGDTVLVIPNNSGAIKTSGALKGLKNFDPREQYKLPDDAPKMSNTLKQQKMGDVSNLITDMTIKGANEDEICRAVKHSMVVIDAEKHHLNYKQSYIDNGIAELKEKYQGAKNAGASTLISKAKSPEYVNQRKDNYDIDEETGAKIYFETGAKKQTIITDDATGKKTFVDTDKPKQEKSTKMAERSNAFDLSSGTPMETIYASHANKLKALANEARKEQINTKPIPYSPSAKKTFATEVASLTSKLNNALKNSPLERAAQRIANVTIAAKKKDNPDLDPSELKTIKAQAIAEARARVGAKKETIIISDKEWDAIQAGAFSNSALTRILQNADSERVKELATPRTSVTLTSSKIAVAKARLASGYTTSEVADLLGVSVSTLQSALSRNV